MAEQQKKMNVVQLTFIVTVNMMGSGIIMLPANMAQVGAISLLSWLVTAVGSLAIAYGFAQAGLFSRRSGGLAGYAEDAFVDRRFSEETADLIPGMRRWLTDEYHHNGLRTDGAHVLDRLIGLARGTL